MPVLKFFSNMVRTVRRTVNNKMLKGNPLNPKFGEGKTIFGKVLSGTMRVFGRTFRVSTLLVLGIIGYVVFTRVM